MRLTATSNCVMLAADSWACASHDIDSPTDRQPAKIDASGAICNMHGQLSCQSVGYPLHAPLRNTYGQSTMLLSRVEAVSIGVYVYRRSKVRAGYIQ
jgi:hypothetical protein